jgi:hypothetical protein
MFPMQLNLKVFCFKISLLFLLPSVAFGQYAVNKIDPALLVDAGVIVRRNETTITVKSDKSAIYEHVYAVTFLRPARVDLSEYYALSSQFHKTKQLAGALYNAQGVLIRKNEKTDIRDYSSSDIDEFSDSRVKILTLVHSTFPYTVEFTLRQEYSSLFHFPNWKIQEPELAVEHSSFQIKAPDDFKYRWKFERTNIEPKVKSENGMTTWFAEVRSLPAQVKEPNMKFPGSYFKYCHFASENVVMNEFSGKMDTWQSFGKFVYDLNHERDLLSPIMTSRVQSMVQNLKTNQDKIDTLYSYLKNNHRYVSVQIGIGGWQAFDANYVEKKKYGDCKALSNYMRAMLKAIGIESHLALIDGGEGYNKDLTEEIPQNTFNHMILYVPSEKLWIECTSNVNPSGFLGGFTLGRKALVLTSEGGKLMDTPMLLPSQNLSSSHIKITILEPSGNANLQILSNFHGYAAEPWYHIQTNSDEKERQEMLLQQSGLVATELTNFEIRTSKNKPEASVSAHLAAKFATKSGSRLNIPIHKTKQFTDRLNQDKDRETDVYIDQNYTWNDTIEIKLPPEFSFEALPDNTSFSSNYGSYQVSYQKTSNQTLICYRSLTMLNIDTPASEYPKIKDWYQKVRNADQQWAVAVQDKRP